MGMQVSPLGAGDSRPRHEIPMQAGARQRAQAAEKERKAAAALQIAASIPGGDDAGKKVDIFAASMELEQVSLVFDKRLQFVVDHESHDVIVKVIDRETDKVIKVLPPEELRRMHDKIKETIGFLLNERV
jgi:flagellar protein FlaG